VELERWRLTVLVEEELQLVQSGRNAAGVGEAACVAAFDFKRGWTVSERLAAMGGCLLLVSLVFEDVVVFVEAA
jgi:hypothetical protein